MTQLSITSLRSRMKRDDVDFIDGGFDEIFEGSGSQEAIQKAVKFSKYDAVVALVYYGADVNKIDSNGRSPMDIAFKNKDYKMVELLCLLGSKGVVHDWLLHTMKPSSFDGDIQFIIYLVKNQSIRQQNIENGFIAFDIKHVKAQQESVEFAKIGISVEPLHHTSNFFMFVARESPDQMGINVPLAKYEAAYSDIYEIRAWGRLPKFLRLKIRMLDSLRKNEYLHLRPMKGTVECESITDYVSDVHKITEKIMIIKVDMKEPARFFISVTSPPETYAVSKESQTIRPEMDTKVEVNIPAGTFSEKGKLEVNMFETKDWNYEQEDDTYDVLFANALSLEMTDNRQPKKPVVVKLPLHSSVGEGDEMIVLATRSDCPREDDWEICKLRSKIGNNVYIEASHFSIFVPASKQDISKSKKFATQACKREHAVECFLMLKRSSDFYTLVVEIVLKRKGRRRRKYWRKRGYVSPLIEYKDFIMVEDAKYQILFDRTIIPDTTRNQRETITFKHRRKDPCNRIFNLLNDTNNPIMGVIQLGRYMKKTVPGSKKDFVEVKPGCLAFCSNIGNAEKDQGELEEVFDHVILPINSDETAMEKFNATDIKVDRTDPQCSIPVLRWKSLRRVTLDLTDIEVLGLMKSLGMSSNVVEPLIKSGTFRSEWYRHWRPSTRPNGELVRKLAESLRTIDKEEEAEAVEDALKFQEEYSQL